MLQVGDLSTHEGYIEIDMTAYAADLIESRRTFPDRYAAKFGVTRLDGELDESLMERLWETEAYKQYAVDIFEGRRQSIVFDNTW